MKRQMLFACLVPVFLSACTNSSGGGGPGKPAAPPEMTKQATHAMSSVQKLFELKTPGRSPTKTNFFLSSLTPTFPPDAGTPDASTPSAPTPLDADFSARQLEKELSNSDCVFDIPIDQDPNAGAAPGRPPGSGPGSSQSPMDFDLKDFRASISGPNCPLEAVLELRGSKNNNVIKAKVSMSFMAKTKEMQDELRAKSMRFDGDINGTITQGPQDAAKMDVKAVLAGAGVLIDDQAFSASTTYTMRVTITPPDPNAAPPANGEFSFDFFTMEMSQNQKYDFQDSATTMGMNVLMKGFMDIQEKYFINGKAATREQYNAYASEISIPGFETPGADQGRGTSPVTPGPAPGTDRPAQCLLQSFDAKEVSLIDIEASIQNGGAPRGFPLQTLQSCQSNTSTEFKFSGGEVRMSINHGFDFVIGDVIVNGQPHGLYIQREDNAKLAAQNGPVTILFQCQRVAQCP